MNLAINGWDVPSVNFLGAVDDGTGKWAKGFWHDSLHPNAAGHDELLRTFVPTLFEALEQGKPAPVRSTTGGFARMKGPDGSITFTPDASMHPFAFGITVRAPREGERRDGERSHARGGDGDEERGARRRPRIAGVRDDDVDRAARRSSRRSASSAASGRTRHRPTARWCRR